jgi:hypothetical protein
VKPTREVLYMSDVGPITGHDMIYGHSGFVDDIPYYLHKTGFMQATLAEVLQRAGFNKVRVERQDNFYQLFGVGQR